MRTYMTRTAVMTDVSKLINKHPRMCFNVMIGGHGFTTVSAHYVSEAEDKMVESSFKSVTFLHQAKWFRSKEQTTKENQEAMAMLEEHCNNWNK